MPDRPKRPRRSNYDERFSLHPMTFEQAVRSLFPDEAMSDPGEFEMPEPQGTYKADLAELRRIEHRIHDGLFADPDDPSAERVMDAEAIRLFIEDEGYRHPG